MKTIEILNSEQRIMFDEIGNKYMLCFQHKNSIFKKTVWSGFCEVTKERVEEDVFDGEILIKSRSTHSFCDGKWFVSFKHIEGEDTCSKAGLKYTAL